jgi:hypothetical protein
LFIGRRREDAHRRGVSGEGFGGERVDLDDTDGHDL